MRRPLPILRVAGPCHLYGSGCGSHGRLTAQESDEPQLRVPGDHQHAQKPRQGGKLEQPRLRARPRSSSSSVKGCQKAGSSES